MALKFTVPEIITVEDFIEFYREKDQIYKYKEEDISGCINFTIIQLNGVCENDMLFKCWNETDTKSIYYRNDKEKAFIQQATLLQTKYNLDNGFDLEVDTNTSASSGSVNFSKNKRKIDQLAAGVIDALSKARIYKTIKNSPSFEEEAEKTSFINKITQTLLEICDRRYVSKYFDNNTHLIHTYNNKNFDVMPISDLGEYISTQIYDEIHNIWQNINLLQNWYNYLVNKYENLDQRVKALEEKNNSKNLDERFKSLEDKNNILEKKVKSLYEEYGKYLDELMGGIKNLNFEVVKK